MKQEVQAGATSRAAQNEEDSFLRSKLSEFEHAVEQLKQQVISEQYARVIEVYAGEDGHVRSCKIKRQDGLVTTRAIQRLFPLELQA